MVTQKSIENFKDYSQFITLKDFNNNIEAFLFDHKKAFTASELIAFKRLTKYAAKIVGVATASVKTILRAIDDKGNGYGISESTFHRMRRKAVKMGILSTVYTQRKDGSQSSNIWVFNRYLNKEVTFCEPSDTPTKSEVSGQTIDSSGIGGVGEKEQLTAHKTTQEIKTNNNINKRTEARDMKNVNLDSSFTSSRVPKEFRELSSAFYGSASTIEELWRVVSVSTYRTLYDKHTVLDMAIDSFKQLIRQVKKGRVRKSIYALFYGIINRQLDHLFFEDLYESGFPV